MKIIFFIPARGGSKGMPNKNVKILDGTPLIGHSIKQAFASKYEGKVVVSTDDENIKEIAEGFNAEVPFLRPHHLATDTSATIDVLIHALQYYKEKGETFELVVLLQPTSPLRSVCDIDKSIDLILEKSVDSVVSVCKCEHSPLWSNTIPDSGMMQEFLRPEIKGLNRQQLPDYYRLNGAVYVSTIKAITINAAFIHKSCYAYKMPVNRSIDIDSELDFKMANLIMLDNKE